MLVRKFAIKLFDRDEGEAANWQLIAETLFKAAFDALDKSTDERAARCSCGGSTGSYERLAADPATNKTQALTGGHEAAKVDLQSSGPGAPMRSGNTV